MKMIWAVIRPEFAQQVIDGLDYAGVCAITRFPVTNSATSSPLISLPIIDNAQEMLMIAVPDNDVAKAVMVIRAHARPKNANNHRGGTFGSGKIFVTYIDEVFTIRTAGKSTREFSS
jgi:nitrogen regulatory protein PII 1